MNTQDSITKQFSAVQASFWMSYCASNGFAAVFLQGIGYTNAELGLIMAVGNIVGAFLGPELSSLVDRKENMTPARLLPPAFFLQAAVLLVLLFFPVRGAVSAIGFGTYIALSNVINSLNMKMYSDALYSGMTVDYGISRGMGSLAFVAASLFLGNTTESLGVRMIPIAGLAVTVLQFLSFLSMKKASAGRRAEAVQEFKEGRSMKDFIAADPKFFILLIGTALLFFTHNTINNFLINIVRFDGGDTSTLGVLHAFIAAVEIPVMVFYSRIFRKTDSRKILRVAFIFFTLKAAAIAASRTVPQLFASYAMQAPSFALYASAIVPYVTENTAKEDSAKAQSLAYTMTTCGGIAASLIGGRLYDMLPVPVTVWIACGVSVLGVAACYIGLSKASAQRPELES